MLTGLPAFEKFAGTAFAMSVNEPICTTVGCGFFRARFSLNPRTFALLFERLLAARAIFFGCGQWNVVLEMAHASGVVGVNAERVFKTLQVDVFSLGVNLMLAVVLVPLRDSRVLVHVLDDLAPAHTGVVRAEADLTLLRRVRNDAHFGAAEVVVEQILEPHTRD